MSSFSVRFFAPQQSLLPSTASSFKPKTWVMAAPTTAPAASVDVDGGRLEPRVEEREGYFVLKEKFRDGINPQEKIKIEKDPLKLFMEGGIDELAKMSFEDLDKAKATKDDIDVRLKWLGLFHRRKHQCKKLRLNSGPCLFDLYWFWY